MVGNKMPKIVDNELLAVGGMQLLDVCNTVGAWTGSQAQTYVDRYLETTGFVLTERRVAAARSAWFAREVGSAFVAGNIERAMAVDDRFRTGVEILPFRPSVGSLDSV